MKFQTKTLNSHFSSSNFFHLFRKRNKIRTWKKINSNCKNVNLRLRIYITSTKAQSFFIYSYYWKFQYFLSYKIYKIYILIRKIQNNLNFRKIKSFQLKKKTIHYDKKKECVYQINIHSFSNQHIYVFTSIINLFSTLLLHDTIIIHFFTINMKKII